VLGLLKADDWQQKYADIRQQWKPHWGLAAEEIKHFPYHYPKR